MNLPHRADTPADTPLAGRAMVESVLVLGALLALWWLASHQQWVSKVFLPTPEATAESL